MSEQLSDGQKQAVDRNRTYAAHRLCVHAGVKVDVEIEDYKDLVVKKEGRELARVRLVIPSDEETVGLAIQHAVLEAARTIQEAKGN